MAAASWQNHRCDQFVKVLDILETCWHQGARYQPDISKEPLDGLVLTVLSQNTNDRNRDVAYSRLRRAFPTWEAVAGAAVDAVEEAIRPAGLAPGKTRALFAILTHLQRTFGAFSLEPLRTMLPGEARSFLEQLPGVGPKTAACTLLFDLGMPAFPADTHVSRICRRLGIVPVSATPPQIIAFVESFLPSPYFLAGHLNLIEHGRHRCRSRAPQCSACEIFSWCAFPLSANSEGGDA